MHRSLIGVIVACGCGRVGFEPRVLEDDAAPIRRPCGATATAPDPVTIQGIAFEFTDFVNTRSPLASVIVDAFDDTNLQVGSTISGADGTYILSIPTGGRAPTLRIRYTLGGYFTTTTFFDAPLDHDVALGDQANLTATDGPLWSPGAMDSIYASDVGDPVDPARSTINIVALDCDDQPLEGVAIALDVAPGFGAYLGMDGHVNPAATRTQLPYANFIAYNAQASTTTITASASGLEFEPQVRAIPAGMENTRIIVRPLQ